MSEFSESYFLRSNDVADVTALLQSAKVPGYVRPSENGWVPFVFPRGTALGLEDLLARLLAANRGLLLEYSYAEDHGVSCFVYQAGERVARVSASFETERARFDRNRFIELGLMTATAADDVERWMNEGHPPGVLVIAASLGLHGTEWWSFAYASKTEPPSGTLRVLADGTIEKLAAAERVASASDDHAGPAYAFARRVVETLVADELVELEDAAAVNDVAESLVDAMSDLEAANVARAVLECLTEHALVAEVLADEQAVAEVVRGLARRPYPR